MDAAEDCCVILHHSAKTRLHCFAALPGTAAITRFCPALVTCCYRIMQVYVPLCPDRHHVHRGACAGFPETDCSSSSLCAKTPFFGMQASQSLTKAAERATGVVDVGHMLC